MHRIRSRKKISREARGWSDHGVVPLFFTLDAPAGFALAQMKND
jgi:hypothetical protein